jgi:hypothetical protein
MFTLTMSPRIRRERSKTGAFHFFHFVPFGAAVRLGEELDPRAWRRAMPHVLA